MLPKCLSFRVLLSVSPFRFSFRFHVVSATIPPQNIKMTGENLIDSTIRDEVKTIRIPDVIEKKNLKAKWNDASEKAKSSPPGPAAK